MPDGMQDAAARAPQVQAATSVLNLHQRLHAVMVEVDYVQKDKKIDAGQRGYMVVTHDAVTAKVRPALVKHRVLYYPQNVLYQQNGNRTEVTMDVVFVNIDDPADRVAVPTVGFGIDQGDKGPGKAMSYAVKYALLKALGLETGEDADNDGEAKHEGGQEQSSTPERQLTKTQARPEFDKLVQEIRQQQSPADLANWGKRNKPRLDAMPTDWQGELKDIYADHKHDLTKRAA